MFSTDRFARVWVSILPRRNADEPARTAAEIEPMALVPGIVINAEAKTREVTRRGGTVQIQNAVDVVTFHVVPAEQARDGVAKTFYKKQAQGLIGLSPRTHYIKAIDGPDDGPITRTWLEQLAGLVEASQRNLVVEPTEDLIDAAAKAYADAEVPTFA